MVILAGSAERYVSSVVAHLLVQHADRMVRVGPLIAHVAVEADVDNRQVRSGRSRQHRCGGYASTERAEDGLRHAGREGRKRLVGPLDAVVAAEDENTLRLGHWRQRLLDGAQNGSPLLEEAERSRRLRLGGEGLGRASVPVGHHGSGSAVVLQSAVVQKRW